MMMSNSAGTIRDADAGFIKSITSCIFWYANKYILVYMKEQRKGLIHTIR